MISIKQAAQQGIERLRQPQWANPLDHLKIDIINGAPGPWTHLYAPFNLECNGRDPVNMIFMGMDYDHASWLPYDGALPESDEYKAAQAAFKGCLTSSAL